MIKSVNVFGATGGIGYSFIELASIQGITIDGYYHQDTVIADSLQKRFPNLTLKKIDLADQHALDLRVISNYDGLLFVAGIPHFSNNIFDFELNHLRNQVNLSLISFLAIIKSLLNQEECSLKKIIFISSQTPAEISSIYHLVKILQEKTFEVINNDLIKRNVCVSIIKAGWINTKMYNKYITMYDTQKTHVIPPKSIAEICLKEFSDLQPYKVISI